MHIFIHLWIPCYEFLEWIQSMDSFIYGFHIDVVSTESERFHRDATEMVQSIVQIHAKEHFILFLVATVHPVLPALWRLLIWRWLVLHLPVEGAGEPWGAEEASPLVSSSSYQELPATQLICLFDSSPPSLDEQRLWLSKHSLNTRWANEYIL